MGDHCGGKVLGMPFMQVTYDIPAAYAAGLASGEFQRFGSVVRDSSRIIGHLPEVADGPEEVADAARRLVKTMASKKGLLIVAAVVAVVAALVIGFVALRRRSRRKKQLVAETRVQSASVAYLDAIRSRAMEPGLVDRMLSAIDDIEQRLRAGAAGLDAAPEPELVEFAGVVSGYTTRLASKNGVGVLRAAREPGDDLTAGELIAAMRRDLTVQRELWAAA